MLQIHNNHMTPMTSNHGDHANDKEDSSVENSTFQIPSLSLYTCIRAIYTTFKTICCSLGEQAQISLYIMIQKI